MVNTQITIVQSVRHSFDDIVQMRLTETWRKFIVIFGK